MDAQVLLGVEIPFNPLDDDVAGKIPTIENHMTHAGLFHQDNLAWFVGEILASCSERTGVTEISLSDVSQDAIQRVEQMLVDAQTELDKVNRSLDFAEDDGYWLGTEPKLFLIVND